MGKHVVTDKMVVPGKQDFTHNVTLIAVVFKSALCSQIIKTMGVWLRLNRDIGICLASVPLYNFIAILDKIKGYFAT
jgi:hypothetical protein